MNIYLGVLVTFITFFIMEIVAWATHKYVMHGFLWSLHKDHHITDKDKTFEKNDAFFLIFGIPGASFIILGAENLSLMFYIGLGISLYGLAYFLVHEIFIHQRIKLFKRTNHPYFKAIRKAHKIHHKNLGKENGECFGMIFVPFRFLREYQS